MIPPKVVNCSWRPEQLLSTLKELNSKLEALVVAILIGTSLGVGYLVGSSGEQVITPTLTMTNLLSTTIQSTVTSTEFSTETSTVVTGVPINASDISSAFVGFNGTPNGIAMNPNNNMVYLTNQQSDNLTVVDLSPFAMSTLTLPSTSDGIAIDSNTGVAFVVVVGGLEEINSSVVTTHSGDLETNELENQVLGVLPVGIKGPLAFDSSTQVIYGTSGKILGYVEGIDTEPIGAYLTGVDVQTGALVANVSLGYPASNIAVDPETSMVFAVGCGEQGPACDSIATVVNGTSGKVVDTLHLNSSQLSTVAVNPPADLAYVSGDQFVALNGTTGAVVYSVNSLECGGTTSMAVIPYLDEVAVTGPWPYVLVYDGSTGALVNMYSVPLSGGYFVAFEPSMSELVISLQTNHLPPMGAVMAFRLADSRGSVDSALVYGNGGTCN